MKFLSCKDMSHLASEAMDRPLTFREWLGSKIHLLMCKPCTRYGKHLKFLRRANQAGNENIPTTITYKMSDDAKERISRHLQQK